MATLTSKAAPERRPWLFGFDQGTALLVLAFVAYWQQVPLMALGLTGLGLAGLARGVLISRQGSRVPMTQAPPAPAAPARPKPVTR